MDATPARAAYSVPGSPVACTATRLPTRAASATAAASSASLYWIRRGELAAGQRVAARLVDLDEVRALLELAADDADQFERIVGLRGVGQHPLLRVIADRVFVAAQDIDRVAADAQPGARNGAGVDGVAHRRVGRSGALGTHVALGRKPGHQVVARRQHRRYGSLRHRLLHRLQVLRARMQEQMHVRVNQSGQQRAVSQVDRLGVRRPVNLHANFGDPVPAHQHFARRDHFPRLHIQQPGRVQHDRAIHRLAPCRRASERQNK